MSKIMKNDLLCHYSALGWFGKISARQDEHWIFKQFIYYIDLSVKLQPTTLSVYNTFV